jgi:hypothetical protein
LEYNTIAKIISLLENKVLARHKKKYNKFLFFGLDFGKKKKKKLVNTNG